MHPLSAIQNSSLPAPSNCRRNTLAMLVSLVATALIVTGGLTISGIAPLGGLYASLGFFGGGGALFLAQIVFLLKSAHTSPIKKELLDEIIECSESSLFADELKTAIINSGISQLKYEHILLMPAREGKAMIWFQEDGDYNDFDFASKPSGTVLIVTIGVGEKTDHYMTDSFHMMCLVAQNKLNAYDQCGHKWMCISYEEYLEITGGNLPRSVRKQLEK